MGGSGSSLVPLRVCSTPSDRSPTPPSAPLAPVVPAPPETLALPLITPGDLIRAARVRWRESHPDDAEGHAGTPPEIRRGLKRLVADVPPPRDASGDRPAISPPEATRPDASRSDASVPDATRPIARIPRPRVSSPTLVPDPLVAVLSSLTPTTPVRVTPRPGRAPLVLALVLATVGVVLLVLALAGQISAPTAADAGELTPVPVGTAAPAAPPTAPARLVVPSADVNSAVRQVGLAPDRSMEVPAVGPDYDLAAWYRYSVAPGEQGPSVIVGHVDSRAAGPSVFFGLGRLRPGDRVTVGRADGSVVDFAVYATRTVDKDAFPTAEVYGPTRGAELRLVTCGGPFDAAAHRYRDDVVVFARLV